MKIATPLLVIIVASSAAGQTTKPGDELAMLRKEVVELRAQVLALLKENRDLLEKLNATQQPKELQRQGAPGKPELAIGMTVDQVNAVLQRKGRLVGENARVKQYRWERQLLPAGNGVLLEVVAEFDRDGNLLSYVVDDKPPRTAPVNPGGFRVVR